VAGELVAVDEFKKLKYLRAVVNEVLRFYTLAVFAARYDVKNDLTFFDGTSVPKGTPCILPLSKVLMDPGLWENPN
jgi:cytochrome P450